MPGARRRAGCAPGSACSGGTGCCSPARRCSRPPSGCGSCPRRAGLARLPLRRGSRVAPTRPPSTEHVWLYTGCVMDAWMRDTHRSTAALIEATGASFAVSPDGCCGALHAHAGLGDAARRLAGRVIASMPGDDPIVVNSAGCGAAMKDYGHLVGTPEAAAFAARVVDVQEWLAPRVDRLPAPTAPPRRRDRAGPLPPAPRPAGPRARARPSSATSPTSSSSTTRDCAAARAVPTRRCSRSSPASSGTARSPPSPGRRTGRGRPSSPAPTRGARCTSRPPA